MTVQFQALKQVEFHQQRGSSDWMGRDLATRNEVSIKNIFFEKIILGTKFQEDFTIRKLDNFHEILCLLPRSPCQVVAVKMSRSPPATRYVKWKWLHKRPSANPSWNLRGADGRLLNPRESLQVAGLKDGDCIAASCTAAKDSCNTLSLCSVVCRRSSCHLGWPRHLGGDSTAVRDELKNVQEVCATGSAFAAMLADGSVIT